MGDVAEQRGDGVPGQEPRPHSEPDPGPDVVGSGRAMPGTELTPAEQAMPAEIDPEQLRQFREFQQFQQFQEFQRFQQAGQLSTTAGTELAAAQQPTGNAPGRKLPNWLQWLGKKLLGWLIFFLLLAIFATWAFNALFGSDDDNSTEAAARMGGGTYHTEELLSQEPHEAVRKVYHHIAQGRADFTCGRFDNDRGIQQRFATNTGHPDCRQAVIALHQQVEHVNDYAESIIPRFYEPGATTVRIDSCDFDIQGGPALGVFTVSEVEMGQWLITEHEPGPTTCGTDTSPTPSR